jgi:hypothetical protein
LNVGAFPKHTNPVICRRTEVASCATVHMHMQRLDVLETMS